MSRINLFIVFHIFIALFAVGIIVSYILNDFQIAYVILGALIFGNSIFQLFNNSRNKRKQKTLG